MTAIAASLQTVSGEAFAKLKGKPALDVRQSKQSAAVRLVFVKAALVSATGVHPF